MSSNTMSPLDPHQQTIEELTLRGLSNREIGEHLRSEGVESGTSERSIRRAKKRFGITEEDIANAPEPAGAKISGDVAEITSEPTAKLKLNTPEDLMKERGLDPAEWEVTLVTINEWDGATKKGGGEKVTGKHTLRQLKINLRRKVSLELVSPARIDGPRFTPFMGAKKVERPKLVVFVGDQQAPYFNETLHGKFLEFLSDFNPDEGVLIGDTIDLPDISRHPNNPEKDVTVQDCVDSGYAILRSYREADPDVAWKKLAGNHDERLRRLQIDKVERLYGVRRAKVPGEELEIPVLDVGHLLRLDELGIDYIRPDGDYEHTQINVSNHLAARHGWIARKGSGASALGTLEHLGYSVVVGHTHRQSIVHKTRHDINGEISTLAACETGCMCLIEGGLGYTVTPDWQAGFATADIFDDGTFHLNLGTFVNDTLYYRDKRY
jgi:hypothetical protein